MTDRGQLDPSGMGGVPNVLVLSDRKLFARAIRQVQNHKMRWYSSHLLEAIEGSSDPSTFVASEYQRQRIQK